jgi:hypothetical protein
LATSSSRPPVGASMFFRRKRPTYTTSHLRGSSMRLAAWVQFNRGCVEAVRFPPVF